MVRGAELRGEGTWVNFCSVCAAGLSEPLPHYSLFVGQLKIPSWSLLGKYAIFAIPFLSLFIYVSYPILNEERVTSFCYVC